MRSKTLICFPVTFQDFLDPVLAKWKNNSKDFIIRFVDELSVKKSMRG